MSDLVDLAKLIGRVDERTAATHDMVKEYIERDTTERDALRGRVRAVEGRVTRVEGFGSGIAAALTAGFSWLRFGGG